MSKNFKLPEWNQLNDGSNFRGSGRGFTPLNLDVIHNAIQSSTQSLLPDFGVSQPLRKDKRFHGPISTQLQPKEVIPESSENSEEMVFRYEMDLAVHNAFTRGYEQGIGEGEAKAEQIISEVGEQMDRVVNDLTQQINDELIRVEKELLTFTIDFVHKLVNYAVEVNPEYILEVLKEALAATGAAKITEVRVSPADLEFIQLMGVAEALIAQGEEWQFVADPTVLNGCIVETSSGNVNAILEDSFQRLKDKIITTIK
jgi:flagellar biosynthesis/type III secretory pathway protein FliH